MSLTKITKSVAERAEPQAKIYIIWDSELRGFGLKVSPNGRKTFVCQYRTKGGRSGESRRLTLGYLGSPWSVEDARSEIRVLLGRVAIGEDPAKEKQDQKKQLTVAELCDQYLQYGCGTKKPSTLEVDVGRIERHIKPLLGKKRVLDVSRGDIRRFLQDIANGFTVASFKTKPRGRVRVRGGKGTATRTVGLLGGIFTYAIDCGLIEVSPVVGIKRFPDCKRTRYLSQKELAGLGEALRQARADGENEFGIDIIKLLIFTGARRGEIEGLRWDEVDFQSGYLKLKDSKTGQKMIPLNAGALQVLSEQKQIDGTPYVFPAHRGDGVYEGTPKVWKRVKEISGLNDVRMHDLRHSFASVAVSGGASLPIIGALLGHKDSATTQRYAHLSDDPLRAATEAIGRRISAVLDPAAEVSQLKLFGR
jgi:integrase